jgi:hypothetical protein
LCLNNFIRNKIGNIDINELQKVYEEDLHIIDQKNPINIRDNLNFFINEMVVDDELFK